MSTKKADPELIAIRRVLRAVGELNNRQQKRVLAYALDRADSQMDMFVPKVESENELPKPITPPTAAPATVAKTADLPF
jgi:hypothetical protein